MLNAIWASWLVLGTVAGPGQQEIPSPDAASCVPADHRLLEFWVGAWSVEWRRQDGSSGRGINRISRAADGCVILEHYKDETTSFEGMSLFSWNRRGGRWEQFWGDNDGSSFRAFAEADAPASGAISFRVELPAAAGVHRITFRGIKPDTFTWAYEVSRDGVNWRKQTESLYRRLEIGPPGEHP